MIIIFNTNTIKLFKLQDLYLNQPINIKTLEDKFLSFDSNSYMAKFIDNDDNSGKQKWVIEQDENDNTIFYIKCLFKNENSNQYLGSPNTDNNVYLYSSNKFKEK